MKKYQKIDYVHLAKKVNERLKTSHSPARLRNVLEVSQDSQSLLKVMAEIKKRFVIDFKKVTDDLDTNYSPSKIREIFEGKRKSEIVLIEIKKLLRSE